MLIKTYYFTPQFFFNNIHDTPHFRWESHQGIKVLKKRNRKVMWGYDFLKITKKHTFLQIEDARKC